MTILYILLAVLVFGLLIFVHELGHFLTAKALGVTVNEFSICMGPAIWKKQKGDTLYAIRAIPIGGYCAMEGEDEDTGHPGAFTAKPWWKRLIILAAGSFMNFLCGLLILLVVYSCSAGYSAPIITGFFDGCPLESEQGLQAGDELWEIDGRRIYLFSDVDLFLSRNTSGVYDLTVKRDGRLVRLENFAMQPRLYTVDGQEQLKYGLYFGAADMTPANAVRISWYTAMDFARMVWMSLGDLVSGMVSVKEMSGPVGIVQVMAETGEAAQSVADGLLNVAYLGAFIAVNLAVMNLLPIPALDGGRIFFLLVGAALTAVTGKKLSPKVEGYIHAAGMILLLAFMAFITLKDIWKLFI